MIYLKSSLFYTLILVTLTNSLFSQMKTELWGALSEGGPISDNGVIYKTDTSGNNFCSVTGFSENNYSKNGGYPLFFTPTQSVSGKIYGASMFYGPNNAGTLFEFNPQTNDYNAIYSFSTVTGKNPVGTVVISSNNKLYGIAESGGPGNIGCIYSYDLNTGTYNVLHNFTQQFQKNAYLILASNGKLYGTGYSGGTNNLGIIYECDTTTGALSIKYSFDSLGGFRPAGNFIEINGSIYGVTNNGGLHNKGVIYQFNISNSNYTKKIDFDSINGQYPQGGLIKMSNGLLAGMTRQGGVNDYGIIFKFNALNNQLTKIHDFDANNGKYPFNELMQLGSGDLYGVCPSGGATDRGVLFKINPSTTTYAKLLDFKDLAGGFTSYSPTSYSTLILGAYGKLFGVSNYYLYEYSLISDTANIVYNYKGYDARKAIGPLLQANDGFIYGIALKGGIYNAGSIFRINPATMDYKILYSFRQFDGYGEKLGLIQASNGKLYGTTPTGGTSNSGTLFEFDISTNTYLVKHNFYGIGSPIGQLVQANNNKIYGATGVGAGSEGYIYEYDISTNSFTTKALLRYPYGGMINASNGKLYGMDMMGGAYLSGSLYEYTPGQNYKLYKYEFSGANSSLYWPMGELIQASNGKLYGTVVNGGAHNSGGLFEFDLITDSLTKLYDFSFSQNGNKYSISQSSNGKIYGIIKKGGNQGLGELFEYDIQLDTLTNKLNFNNSIGQYPYYAPVVISYCPIFHDSINITAHGSYTVPSGDETYTTLGNYTVLDTLLSSCGSDSILTINLSLLPYIGWEEKLQINTMFTVFPNPTYGNFTININAQENDESTVLIYNMTGKLISKKVILLKGNTNYKCNIESVSKGIYIIELKTNNNVSSKKLIVL